MAPTPVAVGKVATPRATTPRSPRSRFQHAVFENGSVRQVRSDPHNRVLRVLPEVEEGEPMLVGVEGKWYDMTSFIPHHPGGEVIKEFIGRDATAQVLAFHGKDVMKGRTPVGKYEREDDAAQLDFEALLKRLRDDGWYRPPLQWFAAKCLVCFAFFAVSAFCIFSSAPDFCPAWLWSYVVPGVSLGLFWQQSAFMAHDLMHNSTFNDRKRDQAYGWFFGNVCFGVSSMWWRDEHFEHHVFTNTVVPGVGSGDPQQFEKGLWAQDAMLRPFAPERLSLILIKLQGFTFLPLCMLAGRVGICFASLTMEESFSQQAGIAVHWGLIVSLLSGCGSWQEAAAVWYIGAVVQGVLAVQLCVSHYDKPFHDKENAKDMSWFRRQVMLIKDVESPWWMDWFHGGLNYHVVHHLMPRLPRAHFREATKLVYDLCDKHGIAVDKRGFVPGVIDILRHLDKTAEFATWQQVLFGSLM
eukprot:TRINITY_DN43310_c0_g1_i1.p1 TRINITY_DN43310_c0_g1~~TRINITY_DN43310_c0_g1_i1.p1  ORF type:complete len:487 (+),score=177.57 TRINITY_DN43310_c0_g1_i1:59-1462(+)